jgi:hypothetical protein
MKQINYIGRDLLTGDQIADAILNYATALARRARADRVDVPVLINDRVSRVEFVLGPASQLIVESVDDGREEPVDDALVADLERRTELLHSPRPVATAQRADAVAESLDLPGDLLD